MNIYRHDKVQKMKILAYLYYKILRIHFFTSLSLSLNNKIIETFKNYALRERIFERILFPQRGTNKEQTVKCSHGAAFPHSFSRGIKSITPFLDRTKHSRT